jgi:hypothetical protein
VTSDMGCKLFPPITMGRRDTAETREQIHSHNRRWECLCNRNCPKGTN